MRQRPEWTRVFHQAPQRILLTLLRGYRLLLSPWLGTACRFEPTCSVYAQAAIEQHGALAGSYLAAWRVLRCHPGCCGGLDPVPSLPPSLFNPRRGPVTPDRATGMPTHNAAAPQLPPGPGRRT